MPTVDLTEQELLELQKASDEKNGTAAVRAATREYVSHSLKREDVAREFAELAETWKRETVYLSKSSRKAMRASYQRIIGLGEAAVPLILKELKDDPADWFWALTALTGENPVPASSAGNVPEMTECWLRWGRERGYEV